MPMLMRQKSFGCEILGLILEWELLRSARGGDDEPIRRGLVNLTAVVSCLNLAMTMSSVFDPDMDALFARY